MSGALLAVDLPAPLLYGGSVAGLLSLIGLILKSIYDSGAAQKKTYIDARTTADKEHTTELAAVKKEFSDRLRAQDERHANEIMRIHEALADLIALIPQEHAMQATAIVVKLGVKASGLPDETDSPDT